MKKRILSVFCVLGVIFVVSSYAAQPGTEADPLITKSYVESVIYPATRFQVVNVPAGKKVIFFSGHGSNSQNGHLLGSRN